MTVETKMNQIQLFYVWLTIHIIFVGIDWPKEQVKQAVIDPSGCSLLMPGFMHRLCGVLLLSPSSSLSSLSLCLCLCLQLQHPSACCVCRQHAASGRHQAVHWPNPYKPPPLRRQAAAGEDQAGTGELLEGHRYTVHRRVSSISVGLLEVVRMWWVSMGIVGIIRRSHHHVLAEFVCYNKKRRSQV